MRPPRAKVRVPILGEGGGTPPPDPPSGPAPLVQYDFTEESGSTVTDVSGQGTPMNLTIADVGNVTWASGGGLTINTETTISTTGAATKLITACQASDEITIACWITPNNTSQGGPARIVSCETSPTLDENVMLGQGAWSTLPYDTYAARYFVDGAGTGTQFTPAGAADVALQHVVLTRTAAGVQTIYVDGSPVASETNTGTFDAWNSGYPLVLGNVNGGGRGWLGQFCSVKLFDFALDGSVISDLYAAGCTTGPPPAPNAPQIISGPSCQSITVDSFQVSWQTDIASNTVLRWGSSQGGPYPNTETNATQETTHTAAASGLSVSTPYYWIAESTSAGGTVQSSEGSCTTLAAPLPPQIISGPSCQPSSTSFQVSWQTDQPSDSLLEYGTTNGGPYPDAVQMSGLRTNHQLNTLSVLSPTTTYYYQVTSTNSAGLDVSPQASCQTTASGGTSGNPLCPLGCAAIPGVSNTGIAQHGLTVGDLADAPSTTITPADNGTTFYRQHFNGSVYMQAGVQNVTFDQCYIDGTSDQYSIIGIGQTGIVLTDCTLVGPGSVQSAVVSPFFEWTIDGCDISRARDGVKMYQNQIIRNSYIHDLATEYDPATGWPHNDGIQVPGGTNLLIECNNIQAPDNQNAALFFQVDNNRAQPLTDVIARDNLLDGGGWTVYWDVQNDAYYPRNPSGPAPFVNCVMTGNRFGRRYQYGSAAVDTYQGITSGDNLFFDDCSPAAS